MQFVRHLLGDESNVEPNGLLCEISPDRWVAQAAGGVGEALVRLWDVEAGLLDEVAVPWPAGEPFFAPLVGGSIVPGEVIVIWGRHVGVLSMDGDALLWGGWVASIPGGGSDPYSVDLGYASGDGFKYCTGYPLLTGARDGQLTVYGGENGLFRCVLGPGGAVVSGFESIWENDSDTDWRWFRIRQNRTQTLPNTSGGFDFVCWSSFGAAEESILVSVDGAGGIQISPPGPHTSSPSEAYRNPDGSVSVIWPGSPPVVATYSLAVYGESPLPLSAGDQHTNPVVAGSTATTPGVPAYGYLRGAMFGLQDRLGGVGLGWPQSEASPPGGPGISLTGGWFITTASADSGVFWRVWKWRPGGWWHLRQRQTLTGADGWPLRHLQAGANHGSHPLRQRQQGV